MYDPISQTLFSGDLGASLLPETSTYTRVTDFAAHIKHMEGFHRRYMPAGKACQLWAQMVRGLEIERIVPQHGAMLEGKAMVHQFIDWVANLQCGVDRIDATMYQIPR